MEVAHITGATRNLGAPKDWDASRNGPCGGLPIRDEMHSPGMPCMVSAWTPTAEDLAALNAGAPVHLSVLGTVHPPVWVWVGEPPAPIVTTERLARITVDVRADGTSCRFELEKGLTFAEATKHVLTARDAITAEIEARMDYPAAKKPTEPRAGTGGGISPTPTTAAISPPDLRVTVGDGKYTVVQATSGGLRALRYGEEWRDLTGDGLVLALAQEIDTLRQSSEPVTSA